MASKNSEVRIVEAVGTAVHNDDLDRASRLEKAQTDATVKFLAAGGGMNDVDGIKKAKAKALAEALKKD